MIYRIKNRILTIEGQIFKCQELHDTLADIPQGEYSRVKLLNCTITECAAFTQGDALFGQPVVHIRSSRRPAVHNGRRPFRSIQITGMSKPR